MSMALSLHLYTRLTGMSEECTIYHKHLAEKIASKTDQKIRSRNFMDKMQTVFSDYEVGIIMP